MKKLFLTFPLPDLDHHYDATVYVRSLVGKGIQSLVTSIKEERKKSSKKFCGDVASHISLILGGKVSFILLQLYS